MRAGKRQPGITLPEMVVVIAIVAVLVGLSMPSVRGMYNSLGENSDGTLGMISSALASAKAIAIKEQRYAGVRFQKVYRQDGNVLKADQYMIFIMYNEITKMDYGFCEVEGIEPIKLPGSVMVMNFWLRTSIGLTPASCKLPTVRPVQSTDLEIDPTDPLAYPRSLTDLSSFSIIFSPNGKLAVHEVRVRGLTKNERPADLTESADDVFNSDINIVNNKTGMFLQDDYAHWGLGQEPSQREFIICEKVRFEKMNGNQRYNYLCNELPRIYINRYTGTIVNK